MTLTLSALAHTWLIDLDGTVFKHNGHLGGSDELLPGVLEFWAALPPEDTIVVMSARAECFRCQTLASLAVAGLRYDHVLFNLPHGERILLNDSKPRGLQTAIAVNLTRDAGLASLVPLQVPNGVDQPEPIFKHQK
jgi:hypothetical protein